MQKYEILGVIGQGAYGVVLRCRHTETKQLVAIKKFKETEEDELVRKTTVREVKVLRMLNQQNVVELKQAFRKRGVVFLVFEYVQYNLLEVLERTPGGLEPELIRRFIYQLLKGLAYMHSAGIVHRDIKPENLLVSDKNQLKICDFGFARVLKKGDQQQLTDYVATRWYRPPELLVGCAYGKEIDLWSVGCILGELIDGMPMFPGENQIDQLFLIQKCLGPLRPDQHETFLKNPRFLGMRFPEITSLDSIEKRYLGKLTPKALSFLKSLLRMDPADRLTALQALRHPYFDGMRQQDFVKRLSTRSQGPRTISAIAPKQDLLRTHQRKKTSAFANQDQRAPTTQPRGRIHFRKQQPPSHARSVNRNAVVTRKQLQQKPLSLEKHHKKELMIKTQAGAFYIQPAIEEHREDEEEDATSGYSRNKIYGFNKKEQGKYVKKNTRTTQGEEDQNVFLSTGQLGIQGFKTKPPEIIGVGYHARER